jgi:hypothetical protein
MDSFSGLERSFRASQEGPKFETAQIGAVPPVSQALTGGFRALGCGILLYAISDMARNFLRLDDRRIHSPALGRRHALLFGSAAQWCRRFCGTVARVALVTITVTTTARRSAGRTRIADLTIPRLGEALPPGKQRPAPLRFGLLSIIEAARWRPTKPPKPTAN